MENTQTQNAPLEGVKMFRVHVFDALVTAPEGAVLVYKLEADSSLPLQEFYVVAFYDGNLEVAWGCGTTPEDALEVASMEWDNLLASSPEREANPFREILDAEKEGE